MVAEEGLRNVNLYDIFANIVPGLSLLFGLLVPFEVIPTLKTLLSTESSLRFGLAHVILLVAFAFITGQLLQAFGSRYDGDHGFHDFLAEIRGEDVESRYKITEFDGVFWVMCRERFCLSDGFDSPDRLFKAVLSYLEKSHRNRALRMQALYLFARGVFVAAVLLTLTYFAIFVSLEYGYFPQGWLPLFRSNWIVLMSSGISGIVAYISNKERKELEEDWINYTMTEFYLEVIDEWRNKRHNGLGPE